MSIDFGFGDDSFGGGLFGGGGGDLFSDNMALLSEISPIVAGRIEVLEDRVTRVVGSREEGNLNIDLGHTQFYDKDAQSYVDDQLDAFLKTPRRIILGWYGESTVDTISSYRQVTAGQAYLKEAGLERGKELPVDKDSGYLVILGLGLGLQVDRLLEELPVRNLVIVEQYPEFLRHSLELNDWSRWNDIVQDRGGRIHVILANEEFIAANEIYAYVRRHNFGMIDGTYVLMHYTSGFTRSVWDELVSRVPVLAANPGFFEDELVMMRNCFRNLRRHDHHLFWDKVVLERETPVIVVASGPSVDNAIDFIRENQEKAVIVTCGTGLGALLGYGIKPDFHVDTENTPGPLEILSGLSEEHDLSGICFIGCNTVDPGVPALFDRRIMYYRDSVTSSLFFGRLIPEVYLAAPTVSNAAMRVMLGLGFRELYLVGVDLGSRDQGRHHSQKSIYLADDTFLETHPEHEAASKYQLLNFGNFGGTVWTNGSFLYASIFMANLLAGYEAAKVYNLSDGLRIKGTIPRLPSSARIAASPDQKTRAVAAIFDALDRAQPSTGFDEGELSALLYELRATLRSARDVFEDIDPDNYDLAEVFDELNDILEFLGTDYIGNTVRAFVTGTLLMFYQYIYITVRRLPEDMRPGFMEAISKITAKEIDTLRDQVTDLIDELTEELRADKPRYGQ